MAHCVCSFVDYTDAHDLTSVLCIQAPSDQNEYI